MPSTEFSQIHSPWTPERHSAEHRVESASIDPSHVLEDLFGESAAGDACDAITLEPRAALPASWPDQYRFAVIRRGYVIRQRSDARGHTTAIDSVGPGGCFPLAHNADGGVSASGGYAVSRALVALCDEQTVANALQHGGATALQIHELESETIVRMERLADARGRSGTAGKVAALLCVLADTLQPGAGKGHSIPGAFLQRDLAGLLSIRHESVCRALREFSGRGLVERVSDALLLKDRPALEAV